MKTCTMFILIIAILQVLMFLPIRADYEDFVKPILDSFPWSAEEEEGGMKKPAIESNEAAAIFREELPPGIVGLRGLTSSYIWYTEAQCMGIMVKTNMVMTLCACVMSWYSSNVENKKHVTPYYDRLPQYDINAEYLYVYYAVDNLHDLTYVELSKQPLQGIECELILKNKTAGKGQEEMFGLFETRSHLPSLFVDCPTSIPFINARVYSFGTNILVDSQPAGKYLYVRGERKDVQNALIFHSEGVQIERTSCVDKHVEKVNVLCYSMEWRHYCGGFPSAPVCTLDEDENVCCFAVTNSIEDPNCRGGKYIRRVLPFRVPLMVDALDYFSQPIGDPAHFGPFASYETEEHYENEVNPDELLKIQQKKVNFAKSSSSNVVVIRKLIIAVFFTIMIIDAKCSKV